MELRCLVKINTFILLIVQQAGAQLKVESSYNISTIKTIFWDVEWFELLKGLNPKSKVEFSWHKAIATVKIKIQSILDVLVTEKIYC